MNIATIEVSGVYASAKSYTHIPAGLVGATVTFEFTDPRWNGLTKTAVFRGNITRDVIMSDNVVRVPPETVEAPGSRLLIGVYGVDSNENIVIPTLWTDIGPIRPAADPSGDPSVDPSLPVWAQLAEEIEKLKSEAPDVPGKPGQDGEDGGYYTPSLTQPDDNTLEFHFTPSKPDMPTVDPVQVELPNSGGDVDFADYIELLPEASYPVREDMGTVDIDRDLTFIAGKTYLVKWNGVDYVRVAYEDDEVVLLGESDDPFSVECFPDTTDIYVYDGSTSVTLAVYEKAKYATEEWVEEKLKEHSGWNVFIAEYGVTANAEIFEANESGKVCFAKYNEMLLPIASCGDTMTTFSGTNGFQFFNIRCNGEKWDVLKMPFTSTLSESSTNVEFPTAKAVVEYVKQNSGGNVDLTGVVKSVNGVTPDENGNVEITVSGGATVATVEPAYEDIPKIFFGGALQQTKDEKVVPFRYISKTDDFSGYAEIKAQGNSSMSYPKKNQTVKMFADEACDSKMKKDFKGWGKQNKHVYKANWIDLTHARNVVSARLWGDVVKSRSNYAELPELLRTSPNQGAVDGFPVKVYAAGVYQGRYTLNIPKDAWMANMDKDLDTHCILCGENYVSGCFRASANINESDWTDEIHDVVPASIKTRWNEVISFVMNSTDEEFKANLSQYFYVDSLIDYYLFGLASCGLDAFGKNQLYMTYDGQKWIASMYDMDSTWGLYWNGSKFVASDYARTSYEDYVSTSASGEGNLLYNRLEQLFSAELQTRWEELKNGAMSIENIINRFERFTDIAPAELVKEDYASTTGGGKFTGIPSQTTNNIQQIRAFALARQAWTDEYVANLTASEPEEPDIPDEPDGPVVPDEPETALLYSLPNETELDGTQVIDTGVKLFENDIDYTIVFDVTPGTQVTSDLASVFSCAVENSPYPGITFRASTKTYELAVGLNSAAALDAISSSITERFKGVIIHQAGGGIIVVCKTVNGDRCSNAKKNNANFSGLSETMIIGGAYDASKNYWRKWVGTVHAFKIYDGVITSGEMEKILGANLIADAEWSDSASYKFDASGNVISGGSNYVMTNTAEVVNGKRYTLFNIADGTHQYLGVAEYDENMTFIKRTEGGADIKPFTFVTQSNTKYVRASVYPNMVSTNNNPARQIAMY